MNIQQLETYIHVVKLRSFTKAAAKLNATQSTVSMRISELEKELGVQLLDRSQRQIEMTAKGRDLLHYASRVRSLVVDIRTRVGDPTRVTISIRIAAAELVALTWLPELVGKLNEAYPQVQVDLDVGLRGRFYEQLRSGEVDLCILPTNGAKLRGLDYTPIPPVTFVFMASPMLNLPKTALRPEQIGRIPLIMLGPNSVIAEIQSDWFQENGVAIDNTIRSNSMEISAGLVRSGLGVSFLPREFYREELQSGRMVELTVAPALPPVSFSIISMKERPEYIQDIVQLAGNLVTFSASNQTE